MDLQLKKTLINTILGKLTDFSNITKDEFKAILKGNIGILLFEV